MLENFSQRFKSILFILLIIMLAGVFAAQFGGPQAEGCSRESYDPAIAVSVDGKDITMGDFNAHYTLAGYANGSPAEQISRRGRENVLNGIVERELLIQEAERLGIVVSPEEAMERVIREDSAWASVSVDADPSRPSRRYLGLKQENGRFERTYFENFVRNHLQRSVGEFAEWQAQELTAERMRDVIRSSVVVSPNEIWDAFVRENEKARIKYVRYAASYYRDSLAPSEQEVTTWASQHQAEINAHYQENQHRYTNLELQVRARHILIKVEAGADETTKQAARVRAEGLLARARGGADFATLARENSEDPGSARIGGDLGWNVRGRMVAPFDEAQFALAPGQISNVVESTFGFHVIKVEGRREGNVPEADAKKEIAENLYRDARATDAARQAAEQNLAQLRSGTTIEQLEAQLNPASAQNAEEESQENELPEGAPKVESSRDFSPFDSPIEGVERSNPIAQAAFRLTTEGPLPERPIQIGQDWFVIRLESIEHAERNELTEEIRQRLERGIRRTREEEAVATYTRSLRQRAEAAGSIRINAEAKRYPGRENNADNEEASPDRARNEND